MSSKPNRQAESSTERATSRTTRTSGGVDPIMQEQARQAARERMARRGYAQGSGATGSFDRVTRTGSSRTRTGSDRTRTGTASRGVRTSQQPGFLQTLLANPIVFGVLALVALLLLVLAVRSCTAGGSDDTTSSEVVETATSQVAIDTTTTYDWANLSRQNHRYVYSIDGQVVSKFGIDVSENNGDIDWHTVAADGVEFGFIRVGYRGNEEGGIHLDEKFKANIQGARAAGIKVGAYFYSQAITEEEGREEARFVLEQLGGSPLEYPIAFDCETHPEQDMRTDNTPRGELAAVAAAFCEEVKSAGYKPLIYGSSNDLARYKRDDLAAYPVWYAEYGGLPEPASGFTFWQFHNDATVSGISTPTDVNLDLTTAAQMMAGIEPAAEEQEATSAQ